MIRDRKKIEFSDEKILLNYPINLLSTQAFPFLLLLSRIISRLVVSMSNHRVNALFTISPQNQENYISVLLACSHSLQACSLPSVLALFQDHG